MSHNFASISELVGEELEHLVQAYLNDKHYTSMVQASFNVIYATINGGIVILPYAASVSGLPLFCSLLVAFCVISGYVSYMLVQMAQDINVRRYEDLAERAYGELGFYTASLLQASFSFLMMVVLLNVWGEIVHNFLKAILLPANEGTWVEELTRRTLVVIAGAVVMLRRSLLDNVSRLTFVSLLAAASLLIAIVAIIVAQVRSEFHWDGPADVVTPSSRWWLMPGIIVFCFSYQHKALQVYASLRRRTPQRWKSSIIRGHSLAIILFMLFACLAFVYMEGVGEDIDMNFFQDYAATASKSSRILFDIARISVAIMLLLTFPGECIATASIIKRIQRRYLRNQIHLRATQTSDRATTATSHSYSIVSTTDSGSLLGTGTEETPDGSTTSSFSRTPGPPHMSAFPVGRMSPNCPDGYTPEQWAAVLQRDLASNASSAPTPQRDRHSNVPSFNQNLSFDMPMPNRLSNASGTSDATLPVHELSWSTDRYVAKRLQQQAFEARAGAGGRAGAGMSVDSTMRGLVDDSTVDPMEDDFEDDDSNDESSTVSIERLGRMSSVGGQAEAAQDRSVSATVRNALPNAIVWTAAAAVAVFVEEWPIVIATAGTFLSYILTMLAPAVLYFKLGVSSDYSVIPKFGYIIPNRLYMGAIFFIGVVLVVGSIAKFGLLTQQHFHNIYA